MILPDTAAIAPFRSNELEYCAAIANIGRQNAGDPRWWASALSSKNFSGAAPWRNLSDHADYDGEGSPPSLIGAAIKLAYRIRLLAPAAMRGSLQRRLPGIRGVGHLFITHLQPGAFDHQTGFHNDRYWTPLLEHLQRRGEEYAVIGLNAGDERRVTWTIMNRSPDSEPLYPIESFNRIGDVFKAMCLCLGGAPRVPSKLMLNDVNLAPLLRRIYRGEKWSGRILRNLTLLQAFQRMFRQLKPARVYWPWENHAWEHLLCIAAELESPQTRRIGFQHTAIPPYLINHFPGKGECDYAPMPHQIITVGEGARNVLETYGHFPDGMLIDGCALRHQYLFERNDTIRPKRRLGLIGVALGISPSISAAMINMVIDAMAETPLKAVFRFHPICGHERMDAQIIRKLNSHPNAEVAPPEPMDDFFKRCGVMLYADSTVGFDAIFSGLPVICLETSPGIVMDPLFELDDFKWRADSPEAIRAALTEIGQSPEEDYHRWQSLAIDYVRNYMHSVNEERLERFLIA